jgi:hypothetical protein
MPISLDHEFGTGSGPAWQGPVLNSVQNLIWKFDIPLTFACLPVGRDFEFEFL